jgi:hypothetical protein
VGYAFVCAADYHQGVWWMRDWMGRKNLEPWMLTNPVVCLRALGRMNEANRVSRHALTLKEDHTTGWHRLWLALDEALASETQSARKRLHGISTEGLTDCYQFVKTMVEGMLVVQEADPKDRFQAFSRGRKMLRQTYRKWQRFNLQCLMPC